MGNSKFKTSETNSDNPLKEENKKEIQQRETEVYTYTYTGNIVLPDVVLEKIFLELPGDSLIKRVQFVCQHWYELINTESFWSNKCVKDKRAKSSLFSSLHKRDICQAKRLYFANLFGHNLLKNESGEEGFKHWIGPCETQIPLPSDLARYREAMIQRNEEKEVWSGLVRLGKLEKSGQVDTQWWRVEEEHNGSESLFVDESESSKKSKNFATSYQLSGKMQVIDLKTSFVCFIKDCIDKSVDLKLEIGEFYAARFDCGSVYKLAVYLIDEDFNAVDSFEFNDRMEQWTDANWQSVKHLFDLSKPFRYVLFHHSGSDTQFWAGFYGSKMAKGFVRLCHC